MINLGKDLKKCLDAIASFFVEEDTIVTVNGKTYKGTNITNDSVIIDGVVQGSIDTKVVNVNITGNCINTQTVCGEIDIQGSCGTVTTTSSDVIVGGNVSGSVTTTSWDINCKSISGNVRTVSGDVYK